jgi:type II secretory pathway component PulF
MNQKVRAEPLVTEPCSVNYWTRVPREDMQIFARQFFLLYSSGIQILPALNLLHLHCQSPNLKETLHHVMTRVQTGHELSVAMRGFPNIFSPIFIGLVQVGESTGRLDTMLERVANLLDKQNLFVRKIQAATVYPMFVIGMSLLGAATLVVVILPRVGEIFKSLRIPLPALTQSLLSMSSVLSNPYVIATAVSLAAIFAFQVRPWLARQQRLNQDLNIAIHEIPLNVPIVGGIIKKIVGARLLQTLAVLLDAGVPLQQAMDLLTKVAGNAALSSQLVMARQSVKAGALLSTALLNCEAFPLSAVHLLSAGEEAAGKLTELLQVAAEMQEEEAELVLGQIVSLLEPIMLVVVSVVVGFLLISTMLPIIAMLQAA